MHMYMSIFICMYIYMQMYFDGLFFKAVCTCAGFFLGFFSVIQFSVTALFTIICALARSDCERSDPAVSDAPSKICMQYLYVVYMIHTKDIKYLYTIYIINASKIRFQKVAASTIRPQTYMDVCFINE